MDEIKRDISLINIGSTELTDLTEFKSPYNKIYSIEIPSPNTGPTETIQGSWTSMELAIESNQVWNIKLNIIEDSLARQKVSVCVVADNSLYEDDVADEVYVDSDFAMKASHVAKIMANQVGAEIQWDSKIDYTVLNYNEPVWHYEGTFIEGLKKLIAPLNQVAEMAGIVIDGTTFKVIALYSPTTSTQINIDRAESIDIRRENVRIFSRGLRCVIQTPKTLSKQVITEERILKVEYGSTLIPSKKVIKKTTLWGPFIIEDEVIEYVWWPHWWSTGGEWVLIKSQTSTYTYEPEITKSNVYWLRGRKVVKIVKTNYVYHNGRQYEVKRETHEYLYNGNVLDTETIRTENIYTYEAGWYDEQTWTQVDGTLEEITYKNVTEDLIEVNKIVTNYTVDLSNQEKTLSQEMATMLQNGPAPSSLMIPNVVSSDFIEETEYEYEWGEFGDYKEMILYWDPGISYIQWLLPKVRGIKYSLNILLRSNYEIKPGDWISLNLPSNWEITRINKDTTEEVNLSDILSEVTNINFVVTNTSLVRDVSGNNPNQYIRVTAVGYKDVE